MSDRGQTYGGPTAPAIGTLTAEPSRQQVPSPILPSVQRRSPTEVGMDTPKLPQYDKITPTARNRPPRMHAVAFRAPGWTQDTFRPPARYAPAHTPAFGRRLPTDAPLVRPPHTKGGYPKNRGEHAWCLAALPMIAAAVPAATAATRESYCTRRKQQCPRLQQSPSGTVCSKTLH